MISKVSLTKYCAGTHILRIINCKLVTQETACLTGKQNGRFLNILSNISNLMIPVHMNGLDSDVSLVKVDF